MDTAKDNPPPKESLQYKKPEGNTERKKPPEEMTSSKVQKRTKTKQTHCLMNDHGDRTKSKIQRARKCSGKFKQFTNGCQNKTFSRLEAKIKKIYQKVEDKNSIELEDEIKMSQKAE